MVTSPPAQGGEPTAGPGRRALLGVVILLLIVHLATGYAFVRDAAPDTDAALTGFPLDDAWIHMVYQRSIAETGRPFYNDGELENGFTSPLWMLVGALPHLGERFTGLSAVSGIKLLGVLLGWLASWALVLLLLRVGCRLPAAAFGGLVLALSPTLTFTGVSGMEGTLAVFLMLAAFCTYSGGGFLRAGVFAGLAVLARPEAVLVLAALPVLHLVERVSDRRGQEAPTSAIRTLTALLLPGLVLMGLWVAYSLTVTGRPLPNTFYAKFQEGGLLDFGPFVRTIAEYAGRLEAWELLGLAVLALAGLAGILLRRERRLFCLALPAFGAAFVYAICVTRDMPDGCTQYYYWWRHLVPALPFLWIPAAVGVDFLSRLSPVREAVPAGRWKRPAFVVLAVVPATLAVAGLISASSRVSEQFAWNCQNINEVQVELGKWVAGNVPAGGTVAVNDAGAIRYFGRRKTLDLVSLNRHEGLEEIERGEGFPIADDVWVRKVISAGVVDQFIGVASAKMRWLSLRDVGHLIIFPYWYPDVEVAATEGWLIRLADGPRPMSGRFQKIAERRSEHLTITDAPPPGKIGQDLMCVYECVYRVAW